MNSKICNVVIERPYMLYMFCETVENTYLLRLGKYTFDSILYLGYVT